MAEITQADKLMLEAQLEKAAEDLAHLYGWKRVHFRTAMNARGFYQTPVAGDGAGFPDDIYAKEGHMLTIVEMKTEDGKLTKGYWKGEGRKAHYVMGEEDWLILLSQVPGIRVLVARPHDLDGALLKIFSESEYIAATSTS